MFRIRPIRESDLERFIELAFQAQLGMTNLPKNEVKLKQQLQYSLQAFEEKINQPGDHYYLFSLEEIETSSLMGISAIQAKTGLKRPLEYYQIHTCSPPKSFPEVPSSYRFLQRIQYRDGPSEICSLFLARNARKEGLGKLLSLSRFLFIAAFENRFTETIFADMRGVILEDGICPFWEGVGKHFLPIEFGELMHRRDINEEIVAQLMPCLPIYLDLLPKSSLEVVGVVHVNTRPALQMLFDQGFKKTEDVDLYDAGPRLIAEKNKIKTIQEVKTITLSKIKKEISSPPSLLSNQKLDFRACLAPLDFLDDGTAALSPLAAKALEIEVGETLLFVK